MEQLNISLEHHLDATAIIHYKRDKTIDKIKYGNLLKQTLKIGLLLESENLSKTESVAIGIFCIKHPSTIAMMLAIMEADFAFCFITQDSIPHQLNKLGIKYFLSDETLPSNEVTLRNSLDCFGQKIYLYKLSCSKEIRLFKDNEDPMNRVCYSVTTTGTTGQKKIVHVTYNCIMSNIISFQRIFKLNKDVIYSSAPCTFDVFVLDVFLTVHSGSSLLLMDRSHYSEESLDFMFSCKETGVTFLQITPSLFQRYGFENIKSKIMDRNSSLKFLLLGGERFPSTRDVLSWQNWDDSSRKRVFNVYGVTEMSCWAMIHEVTKEDLISGEVPLGKLLDDTSYGFVPDPIEGSTSGDIEEILLITEKRFCFVDNKPLDELLDKGKCVARYTGDFVRRHNNNIYFYSRRDDFIKRFGERVDLHKIENTASNFVSVAACIYMKKKIVLFVKTDDESLVASLNVNLKEQLLSSEFPDEIRKISFFPLSVNGKVCKQQLKEIYKDLWEKDREKQIEAEETFLEAINQILNLKLGKTPKSTSDEPDGKRKKTEMDLTFKALGLSSFDALRISMKLEDQTGLTNGLLPMLLDDRHTINEICLYLKTTHPRNSNTSIESPIVASSSITTKVLQRYNLDKCVDSSPALLHTHSGSFISVGSHSHKLITIDAESLKLVSTTMLTDRIEGEVTQLDQSGLIGCYDGNLFCFDLQSGLVLWKFDSQGMIKSKPLVLGRSVIFGNYNYETNLWCIKRTESGEVSINWKKLVGSRGILAAPLLVRDTSILICTLDGTCELVNASDGEAIWTKSFESPVFSCPQKVPSRDEILVAEVSKTVHCIDFEGNCLWKFSAEGHIFSSFLFHQETQNEIKIFFGSHDKKLRCLNYNFESQSALLVWCRELTSQIYGTPRLTSINSEDFIVSCATDGTINFVNLTSGSIEHAHKLNGEVFSTPLIIDKKMFVGCRDNFLYCLKF